MTTDRSGPIVEVLDDSAISGLAPEWDDLLADSEAPTVFLTWAWVSSWEETLGRNQRLVIAVARRPTDRLLVGIAPMAIERRIVGRVLAYRALQFAGSGVAASDHLDLVIRTGYEHVAEPLWSAVCAVRGWDVFALDGLRPGSRVAELMSRRSGFRARYVEHTTCPAVALPGSWEDYVASLGHHLRRNLKRYPRMLERDSGKPVTYRTALRPEDVDETIRGLASLHLATHAQQNTVSTFAADDVVKFHQLVATRFLAQGMLRLYRLDVGGSIAAAAYCFSYGGVVSFFQTGYDPNWGRYGPGRQVTGYAIRAAIEERAHRFDFLRGNEAYKMDWRAEPVFDERIWMPVSPIGRILIALRTVARRTTHRLDTPVR